MNLEERFDRIERKLDAKRAPDWLPDLKLSINQIAAVANISHHNLRRYIRIGSLECEKDGASYWFNWEQAQKAIKFLKRD